MDVRYQIIVLRNIIFYIYFIPKKIKDSQVLCLYLFALRIQVFMRGNFELWYPLTTIDFLRQIHKDIDSKS